MFKFFEKRTFENEKPRERQTEKVVSSKEMSAREFLDGVNRVRASIVSFENEYQNLRRLPSGASMEREQQEEIRGMRVLELKSNINSTILEAKNIKSFAETQTLSSYVNGAKELGEMTEQLLNIYAKVDGIIVPEEFRNAA